MKRLSEAETLSRLRQVFLEHGYDGLSMERLAAAASLSRRAPYDHCPSKEAADRAMIRWLNEDSMTRGVEAGRLVRDAGGTPVDILAAVIDERFGVTRRRVESSPHAVESNAVAFATCRDIAIDVAIRFQHDLAELITSLVEDGTMRLRPTLSAADIAQILAQGARGVNQALPPPPVETFAVLYRQTCDAVAFGVSVQPPKPRPGAKKQTGAPAQDVPSA